MGMSIVLYEGVVDADGSNLHTKESALKAYFRLKKLRKAKKKAEKSLERTVLKIRHMTATFDEFCGDLKDQFDALNAENTALKEELARLELEEGVVRPDIAPTPEDDGEWEDDDQLDSIEEAVEEMEESDDEKRIKRMYRKIARRWGPGRAITNEEVEWFIDATVAYKRRDIAGVQRIYDILIHGREACEYNETLREIAKLEREIEETEETKINVLAPHREVYMLFYKNARGRDVACRSAFSVVKNKVEMLGVITANNKRRIEELLKKRKAREKCINEEEVDPFEDVAPSLGFWSF
jgi:chemotaxis protein histidine kinase CheA